MKLTAWIAAAGLALGGVAATPAIAQTGQMGGGYNHPGMSGGMQPGMNGRMQPGMNGGMQPGMQPGMNGGMQPGMEHGMNGGMEPGMHGRTEGAGMSSSARMGATSHRWHRLPRNERVGAPVYHGAHRGRHFSQWRRNYCRHHPRSSRCR